MSSVSDIRGSFYSLDGTYSTRAASHDARSGAGDPSVTDRFGQEAAIVTLSPEAQKYLEAQKDRLRSCGGCDGDPSKSLSDADQQRVAELKREDPRVRMHEQQHLAGAGGFAKGGPSFEFVTGPDGCPYAVGGHVDIDTSPISGDPAATIQKAEAIQRAALAPADPSGADRAVAAQAAQMEAQARMEIEQAGPSSGPASDRSGSTACASGCGCGRCASSR